MKTDARVRYTLKMLKDSLLRLLEEKPINKITVKEVCERAELNRATFYLHFSDCFELLESIENDLLRDFETALGKSEKTDVAGLIAAIVYTVLVFTGHSLNFWGGLCSGITSGMMVVGDFITSKNAAKIRAFKLRLLGKK